MRVKDSTMTKQGLMTGANTMEKNAQIAKKIARYRHTRTKYDKNLDLMYDADGNPTPLRREINRIIGLVVTGQVDPKILGSIKNEIKYARRKVMQATQPAPEPKYNAKTLRKQTRQEALFKENLAKYWEDEEKKQARQEAHIHRQYKRIMLLQIGMDEKSLNRLTRRILPKK